MGAKNVVYENGVDYAAKLSTATRFHGYTAIPLGNTPTQPFIKDKRWARGVLKGPRQVMVTGPKDKRWLRDG